MRAPCYSLRLASAGVYFILLLALRLVNCQYRYHFPRRRHNHFLVDFAYCVPTMAVTGVRFGICVYLRHLLLRTKRDRRRLQIDKGVIVSAIVIVVKSVELNRKGLDECYISGLDNLGSRLPNPVCLRIFPVTYYASLPCLHS